MTDAPGPGLSLLLEYPETNPFAADPPIHNLTPEPFKFLGYDTPELRESVRAVAYKTGINLLALMYGTNPLIIVNMAMYSVDLPMSAHRPPPPLPEAQLPPDVTFLEEINPSGNTPLFRIIADGKIMLLKVFPNREDTDSDDEEYLDTRRHRTFEELGKLDYKLLFEREREAYAHLVHYGVCRKGTVPNCYGWLQLSGSHVDRLQELPNMSENTLNLPDEQPPMALLLEFIDSAEKLSWGNITEDVADKVVRSLYEIHAAYVRHGDIHSRNVLVRSDGRIVWIDFDRAETPSVPTFRKGHLLRELEDCWGFVWSNMLPNKRIGWADPWH